MKKEGLALLLSCAPLLSVRQTLAAHISGASSSLPPRKHAIKLL